MHRNLNALLHVHSWGLWCQKQVSQAGISNCIPQNTVGCSYLSLPEIPASGAKVHNYNFQYLPRKWKDKHGNIKRHLADSWWRHQMETFSALLAICAENSPVPGEFPAQRPVTRSFDDFFDLRLNKRLSKQSWVWWSETLSRPLWRHCNVLCHQ